MFDRCLSFWHNKTTEDNNSQWLNLVAQQPMWMQTVSQASNVCHPNRSPPCGSSMAGALFCCQLTILNWILFRIYKRCIVSRLVFQFSFGSTRHDPTESPIFTSDKAFDVNVQEEKFESLTSGSLKIFSIRMLLGLLFAFSSFSGCRFSNGINFQLTRSRKSPA